VTEHAFLGDITIGQYLPTGSLLHRLDPRTKLVGFVILVGVVSFTSTFSGNVFLLALALALLVAAWVPLGYALSGLRPFAPWVAAFALFQILFTAGGGFVGGDGCRPLAEWWFVVVSTCSVKLAIVSTLRFVVLFLLASWLTFTTTTTELSHGTERLLRPLVPLGVPAHELALVLTIALRFVPTLAQETERLIKAQVSRGADFGAGSRWGFVKRTRHLLPLLVPLFLNSLRRAEVLAQAMEARCYGGGVGRTQLIELDADRRDVIALALVVAVAAFTLSFDFVALDAALSQMFVLPLLS
jgi:energy-coupling factor transport system permease protein